MFLTFEHHTFVVRGWEEAALLSCVADSSALYCHLRNERS